MIPKPEGGSMKDAKECEICGTEFVATHGRQTQCPECRAALQYGRGRNLPRTYEGPADFEAYEKELRERNFAKKVQLEYFAVNFIVEQIDTISNLFPRLICKSLFMADSAINIFDILRIR